MQSAIRVWVAVVVVVLAAAGPAAADSVTTGSSSYNLTISENANVLAHPGNVFDSAIAGATTGHELAIERSEPYFLLTNTSSSSLTEFQMTIGAEGDHFRFAEFVASGSSSGVSMTVLDPTAGSTSGQVTLEFTGLAPGATVEFRAGIAADSGPPSDFVDYRSVFFDNGTGNNSVSSVMFANSSLNSSTMLSDQFVASPFAVAHSSISKEGVQAFQFSGSTSTSGPGGGGSTPVLTPEPNSLVLLGLGLAGLTAALWRRRRQVLQPVPVRRARR